MTREFYPIVDLRSSMSEVRDQYQRPSCVAFAVTAGHEYHKNHTVELSEEFLFRCCKIRDKNISGGTSIKNALTNLKLIGQVENSIMPYQSILMGSLFSKIELPEFRLAKKNKIMRFSSIPKDTETIESSIFHNHPVISVVGVNDNFFYQMNIL
jgi:hypothetical protein